MKDFETVYNVVKNKLSEKRFFHSVCVMERAVEYAKIYGVDEEKAKLVGIAHDILKETSKENRIKEAEELGVVLDNIERVSLALIHAKAGAAYCRREFGFSDDMCDAIKYHTTGRANMTTFEKIIYLADATGRDRDFEEAPIGYELAKKDLDKALMFFFKKTIEWQLKEDKKLHFNTIDAYNFLAK